MSWNNASGLPSRQFKCGYCSSLIASHMGYASHTGTRFVYVCPHCDKPTYIDEQANQIPGVPFGNAVAHLPAEIASLYKEIRVCTTAGAFTGAVLLSRKLLMNVAVSLNAEAGKPFIFYVEYLAANGYVPPNGKGWVDHIRQKGNEATHEIQLMRQVDAEELIGFAEMLLKFVYEFPSKIPKPAP